MPDVLTIEVSIPSDNDGFILLQCSHCGSFFKITADDLKEDSLLMLYCPSSGLVSESYFTENVISLACTKLENSVMDVIYGSFKSMEKVTKHSALQVKAGKKPSHKEENPIRMGVDSLELSEFKCCKKKAKVKPLLKMIGCYCPFCGVKDYEVE